MLASVKFDAFNEGFQGDLIAQNFTACSDKFLVLRYYELPTFLVKYKYSAYNEAVLNSTIFLQNATYPLYFCTDAAQQMYYYAVDKASYYGSASAYAKAAT